MSAGAETWTVLGLLKWTEAYFKDKGLEQPRRQAEELLGHVLELDRLHLYLEFERLPSPTELALFRDIVKRRAAGEPLQHLLGWQPFLGMRLKADPRALIPRPETELLALRLQAWLKEKTGALRMADICTGGGCLALALAQACKEEDRIWAADISAEALQQAVENAETNALSGKVRWLEGDLAAPLEALGLSGLDLICANPPYIRTGDIPGLQIEVRGHDPHLALDGGPSGMELPRRLLAQAHPLLKTGGFLAMELGSGQPEILMAEMKETGLWEKAWCENDAAGRSRYLMAARA
jgi:release factor glutamine methyltransferase